MVIATNLSPMMEKIVSEILQKNGEIIEKDQFKKQLYKIRFSNEDTNNILRHLEEKGYILRTGRNIYILRHKNLIL